jgi:O-Antigen ligase
VAAGNPVTRIRHSWENFKVGALSERGTRSRVVSGLGNGHYDIYRVALDEFVAHPLVGIGADNFQQQYLQHRRSNDTPRYPHSIELRTLTETGLVGTLLGLIGLCAGLLAGMRAARSTPGTDADPLARAVAAGALAGFAYWVVHGSVDWFWEIAGLGAPAFAMLGLACAVARPTRPNTAGEMSDTATPAGRLSRATVRLALPNTRRLGISACVLVALASAASLTSQWIR